MPDTAVRPLLHFRSVFISDLHLGFRGCAAGPLLEFLTTARIDQLYLLGDIVDLSGMRRSLYWPKAHNDVLSTIFRLASHGTRVVYVPGNHDEDLRAYTGARFGGVRVQRDLVHTTADGRRLWLTHGDEFDSVASFEHAVAHEARRRGMDGVVCGHIHRPMMRNVDGVLYCNDGDWVESCSLLAEDFRGRLRVVHWLEARERLPARVGAGALAA